MKETLQTKLEEILKQKEQLYTALKELEQQKEQIIADIHAHQGAEQILKQLIEGGAE